MYYTNSIKITLKNNEAAVAALEIMKTRLSAGFDWDKKSRRNPSMQMHDALNVTGKIIELPEEFGCYLPDDAAKIIHELMKDLAVHFGTETFTFENYNRSDYDEGWIRGSYVNGELKIKTTYLPSGFGDYYCPECDEVIATMKDDEDGNIYIDYDEDVCPECGEEIDWFEWLPIITEKSFQII